MSDDRSEDGCGPWNPGIASELPREYLPLSTMYRPQNVTTNAADAHELTDFCGLPPHELIAIRAGRLTVHELLIRITADISVADGQNYEDLGINFRRIASVVLERYIAPHREHLASLLEKLRLDALRKIFDELAKDDFSAVKQPAQVEKRRSLASWLGFGKSKTVGADAQHTPEERDRRAIARWHGQIASSASELDVACYQALFKITNAIVNKRGRLIGDRQLIANLAATLVCNGLGSKMIGRAIEPHLREAATREGYRFLPAQDKPVVLNVKGASAAGKSTMRPLQRALAERLKIPWQDFALVSPDIWRKFLLDYSSLGKAYKYAGTLTGHEVEIIDKKLDRYMADKAAASRMSHLLIDRFRFDSFVAESEGGAAGKLLTRFGDLVYMFFVITPPEATVERAWERGNKFGRYKAVDDLLDHNVEAYTGMPQLFFTWAGRSNKRVHYEFLDNAVPKGSRPRTIAFGWNGEMNILDIGCMIDIDRYRKININAAGPDAVHGAENLPPQNNVAFLKQCARFIPVINFADFETGYIYARLEDGCWVWRDENHISGAAENSAVKAGLDAIGSDDRAARSRPSAAPGYLDPGAAHTLGAWGNAHSGSQ